MPSKNCNNDYGYPCIYGTMWVIELEQRKSGYPFSRRKPCKKVLLERTSNSRENTLKHIVCIRDPEIYIPLKVIWE